MDPQKGKSVNRMKNKDRNQSETTKQVISDDWSLPKVPIFKQTSLDQPVCKFALPVITAYESSGMLWEPQIVSAENRAFW